MLDTIMWDGRTEPTSMRMGDPENQLALFADAKSGHWDRVLAFLSLPDPVQFVNVLEPDNPSLNTVLHYAALTNADLAVVYQLVNMGAWRTRRNANHQTALDMAIQQGHKRLYDILEPVLTMAVPPETLQRLEHHFHDFIRTHKDSGPVVAEQRLQLPQLAPSLEMGGNPMFFLIPGMFGGINYRLENGSSETVLYTHISSRMDGPSDGQIHRIKLSGIELLAEGEEIDFLLLLEIIHGHKRIT
jgi:hypothetical protein